MSLSRQDYLFQHMRRDACFSGILDDFLTYGGNFQFSWFKDASYTPQIQLGAFDSKQKHRPIIILNKRMRRQQLLRIALHELQHFEQDRLGLFCMPHLNGNSTVHMPSLESFIHIHLFCEALASTEADRATRSILNQSAVDPIQTLSNFYRSRFRTYFYHKNAIKMWHEIHAHVLRYVREHNNAVSYVLVPTQNIVMRCINDNSLKYLKNFDRYQNDYDPEFSIDLFGSPAYFWAKISGRHSDRLRGVEESHNKIDPSTSLWMT